MVSPLPDPTPTPPSDLNTTGEHPDEAELAKEVASMSDEVKQAYADYLAALDDAGAPGNEELVKSLRHSLRNAMNAEKLRKELDQRGSDA